MKGGDAVVKKVVFALLALLIIAGAGFDGLVEPASAVVTLPEENEAVYVDQISTVQPDEELPVADQIVFTPTVEEIKEDGYPVNDAGETYGPDVKDSEEEPDLILAIGENDVVGYVRAADLDGVAATSPDSVAEYMSNVQAEREIPLYAEDGLTVLGTFTVGNSTSWSE